MSNEEWRKPLSNIKQLEQAVYEYLHALDGIDIFTQKLKDLENTIDTDKKLAYEMIQLLKKIAKTSEKKVSELFKLLKVTDKNNQHKIYRQIREKYKEQMLGVNTLRLPQG